ncbi:T9SS type A sorting domain-containing protein [Urechidicola croceus]|uniref:Secretion system C-terminal sorting domain-containing protein n=1 Tax=Urechidicola croceus TaxID=1850246 RepID=A0A1D8P8I7_9FLAO|nr:T9SS type A sorting domain-containing protein [Urechidicola croceus]AOW20862.1 hypothetical protein LPB138_09335 [Urechidicola croceus]
MKQTLLFILLGVIFNINLSAQNCPTINGNLPTDVYYMSFNTGPVELDYPEQIQILGTDKVGDPVIITYSISQTFTNGVDYYVDYAFPSIQPWTGVKIDPNNFSVDFGLGNGECSFVGQVLPVDEIKLIDNVGVYPNPVKRGQYITVNNFYSKEIGVTIYSLTGKVVSTNKTTFDKNIQMNISHLNEGIYLVKISSENETITKKLVVTH